MPGIRAELPERAFLAGALEPALILGLLGSVDSLLTSLVADSRRCCMNTRCGWGGVARTSRDPPQEPHYGDAVEGPSHV